MPRLRRALASLSLLASLSASAQQTSGSPQTIRTISRIVYVDVVVRDGNGNVVHGLQQDNFSLTESKQKQKISLFEEHSRKPAASISPAQIAAPPHEVSNIPAGEAGQPLNLVLFDLVNTAPEDQSYARQRMIAFLRALPPGREVALFVLSNRLHMIQGFTSDSGLLAKAAESIDIKQMNRLRPPGRAVTDTDTSAYLDAGNGGISRLGASLQNELFREDIQNLKVRLDLTNGAFLQLARAVNGYPGRKNLFWLAGQFPSYNYFTLQSLGTARLGNFSTSGGAHGNIGGQRPEGAASSEGLALESPSGNVDRAIADSQTAIYPISVIGVQTDSIGAENSGRGTAGGGRGLDTASSFFSERQNGRSVMDHIADETGGEAFYGNNDAGALLKRGFEDGENFYTLAYQPTDHNWNSRYRAIAVSLGTRGYHLSYRRGYFAIPEQPTGNALQQFAAAMRMESPPSTMLALRATQPTAEASPGVAHFDTTLDLHGIGFTATPSADDPSRMQRIAHLQLLLIAYPRGGAGKPTEINNALNLSLTPDDYSSLLRTGLPFHQSLHLASGDYNLRLGVVDNGSGRIGTLTLPFHMP